MKPLIHAKISVKQFGGQISDYMEIHNWFDQTKAHIPDARHRLILHNSFGIFLAEQFFGKVVDGMKMPYIINSDNVQISVRDIGEQHVLDDLGHIPTLEECFRDAKMTPEIVGGVLLKIKQGNFILVD